LREAGGAPELSGDVVVMFPDHGLKYVELLGVLLAGGCIVGELPGAGRE